MEFRVAILVSDVISAVQSAAGVHSMLMGQRRERIPVGAKIVGNADFWQIWPVCRHFVGREHVFGFGCLVQILLGQLLEFVFLVALPLACNF